MVFRLLPLWLVVGGALAAAVAAPSPEAVAAFRYAAGLFDMGEYALASEEFSRFLASFPTDSLAPSAAYWLGESLFRLERFGEAADAFGRALRPGADPALQEDARLRKAEALWAANDAPGAILAYEALLSAHPLGTHRGRASYWLGRAYLSLGRKAEAARVLRSAAAWGESVTERADAALLAGDVLRELRRCEEAAELYRDVLRLTPQGPGAPNALQGLAHCAMEGARWEEAVDALRTLTESFPTSPQATVGRFHLAECLATLKRPTEALASYKAVLRDEGAKELWDEALYGEAWAYAELGDTIAALASFARLSTQFPTSPLAAEGSFREAQLSYASGEYARAIRAFGRLLAEWPASPRGAASLYWRGWAYRKSGALADAERDFLNYAASYPDSPYAAESLLLAGMVALDQGSPARACQTLERASVRYGQSVLGPKILAALASAYAAGGATDKADEARARLALEHPGSEEGRAALLQKAYSEIEKGRDAAAVASLSAFLARPDVTPPQKAQALFHLAEAHYRLGDWAEAESLYAMAEEANVGTDLADDALYGRAWAALKRGDLLEVERRFRRLVTAYPESPFAPEAAFRVASALYDLGRLNEAASAFARILEDYPGTEYADDAVYALGWTAVKRGDRAQASVQFRRLVEMYPTSELLPDALFDLASCEATLERPAATARTLHRLLRSYPTYPRATEAAEALVVAYDTLGKTVQRDSVLAALERRGEGDVAARTTLSLAARRLEEDPIEARGLLGRIVERYPRSPEAKEARLQLARFLAEEGRHAEVVEMTGPLCTDPDPEVAGRACLRVAEARYETADYAEAARLYEAALSKGATGIDPGLALYGLALCRLQRGEKDGAIAALRELFLSGRGSPVWTDGAYRLAQLLVEADRKKEAAEVYAALGEDAQAGPLALDAAYRRALLLRERKAYAQAAVLLRKVASGADSLLAMEALFELGRTLHEQGRLTDATAAFLELSTKAKDPSMVQRALYSAGVCQAAMKRWSKASEYFAKASAMPGAMRADALLGRGWAQAQLGDHRGAAMTFETLLRENPDYGKGAEVAFRLAQSLAELGRYAQVDSICSELVVRQDWPYPDRALYLSATAREKMGDKASAQAAYRELITAYPSSSLVPYAKAHLDALGGEG